MGLLGRWDELPLLSGTVAELERINGGPIEPAGPRTRILLVSTGTPLQDADLAGLPGLAHVALCGTSFGRIDTVALARRGITTSHVTDYGDHPTAEVVFMQLVALARGFGPHQWRAEPHELAGRSLVIIGLGALGGAMAHLGLAYRMRVSYVSRSPKPEWEARGLIRRTGGPGLTGADMVVLTGPTNIQVLGPDDFSHLDGAIVVQASSGRVIDVASFLRWIACEGNFAVFDDAAGADARASFAHLPRVVFPRVTAGMSHETYQRLGERVVENVRTAVEQLG